MKRVNLASFMLLLAGLMSGCAILDSPEGAAKEWLQAFVNLDSSKVSDLTCTARQSETQQAGLWLSAFGILPPFETNQQTKPDVSGLRFQQSYSTNDSMNLHVVGKVRTLSAGPSQNLDIFDTWLMVRESGRWRFCGRAGTYPIDTSSPGIAAIKAVAEWANLHPTDYSRAEPESLPYRILRSKVLANDGSSARVLILALIRETFNPVSSTPRETTVETRNVGGNWSAQPIRSFEPPFVGILLTAETPNARQCSTAIPRGTRPDNGYPCIKLTNKGNFDWKWDRLDWGGNLVNGFWSGGVVSSISLPPGASAEVSWNSTWKEASNWKEVGWEEVGSGMQVVLLSVR